MRADRQPGGLGRRPGQRRKAPRRRRRTPALAWRRAGPAPRRRAAAAGSRGPGCRAAAGAGGADDAAQGAAAAPSRHRWSWRRCRTGTSARAPQAVLAHRGAVTEVSPWMYGLDPAGGSTLSTARPGRRGDRRTSRGCARPACPSCRPWPTSPPATGRTRRWPGCCTHPALMAQQVSAIVALVQRTTTRASTSTTRTCTPATGRPSPRSSPSWPARCTPTARCSRSRCSPRPAMPATRPRQRGPGLRGHRPRRRPGAAHGLRLPLGDLSARPGRPGRLGPRRAALRQDADPGGQDHSRHPALRLRLVRRPRHRSPGCRRSSCPGATTRRRVTTPPARHRGSATPTRPGDGTPSGSRTRRARGRSSRRPTAPASAASTCGCTATRTPPPGPRCTRCCRRPGRTPSARRRRSMMPWWVLAVLVLGVNFALWGTVGLARLIETAEVASWGLPRSRRPAGHWVAIRDDPGGRRGRREPSLTVEDVAVLIPAHNESAVIGDTLRAIMTLVPAQERPRDVRRLDRRHRGDRPARRRPGHRDPAKTSARPGRWRKPSTGST